MRKKSLKQEILEQYDPLAYCPPKKRKQFQKRAKSAASGSLSAAIDLFCLQCVNWDLQEVLQCTDPSCPLWLRAKRKLITKEKPKILQEETERRRQNNEFIDPLLEES